MQPPILLHKNYTLNEEGYQLKLPLNLETIIPASIANLNSTLMWNLILQIHLLSIVEFNLSEPSVKIMVINMTVSSQQEGTTYG